jgi:hypothetical protein
MEEPEPIKDIDWDQRLAEYLAGRAARRKRTDEIRRELAERRMAGLARRHAAKEARNRDNG